MTQKARQLANQRRYRLRRIETALDKAGLKTERHTRSVSVEVWRHPNPNRAHIGETVAQAISINWSPEEGYVWYEGGLRNPYLGRHASKNIETIVQGIQSFVEDIRHIPAMA